MLPIFPSADLSLTNDRFIGTFAAENSKSGIQAGVRSIPAFRVTVNDRLEPNERFVTIAHELGHIFCGHLGGCSSRSGREDESGWPDRRSLGKNEREIEAEYSAGMPPDTWPMYQG